MTTAVEPPQTTTLYRRCEWCGQLLPLIAFAANQLREDGLASWCTPCFDHEARRTRTALALRRLRQKQGLAAAEASARAAAYDPAEIGVAWQKRAACKPGNGDDFFPDTSDAGASEYAREICRRCPVAALCDADAAASKQKTGVWGGRSHEPRRRKPAA